MEVKQVDETMWTDTPPYMDGYYWWRYGEEDTRPEIVLVNDGFTYFLELINSAEIPSIEPTKDVEGLWIGPLTIYNTTIDYNSYVYNNL